MKLNLKSTIAAPAGNNSCQKALNGIIGNTRRGIVVDKTLDPDSNNPVANKPVSTTLAALAGQLAKGQVVFLDQLPESGEPHKVYVLTATNQRYWWDGSAFVKIVPTASGSANIISNDMIHYTAEEGKVYDKLVFPNGDKYAQYFPLEGDVGTSYYYRAKRVDFSENEDEPDKISLSYIKFLLDGGKIKRSSVDADLPKYEAFEGVQTKANNSLQKPEITPTKTKLVGVGTNGQENIEIGDNLTLANGKLSATGGGGGSSVGVIKLNESQLTTFNDNNTVTFTTEQIEILKNENISNVLLDLTAQTMLFNKYVLIAGNQFIYCILITYTPEDQNAAQLYTISFDLTEPCTFVSSSIPIESYIKTFDINDVLLKLSKVTNYGSSTSLVTYKIGRINNKPLLVTEDKPLPDFTFTEDKTISLFGNHSILVPKDSSDTNILPLPSDASTSTYVLKAVNGTVKWVKES